MFFAITVNHGDRKEFRVRGLENLNRIVDFFNKYRLQTQSKQKSFEIFSEIIGIINDGEHLSESGKEKIAILVSQANKKIIPRYLKSSETIRQNS